MDGDIDQLSSTVFWGYSGESYLDEDDAFAVCVIKIKT